MIRRIAEKSDGWLPFNTPGPLIADTWNQVRDLAEAAGRDPRRLRLVVAAPFVVVTGQSAGPERQLFHGSPKELVEDFAATAEAGAHELILNAASEAGLR